MIMGYCKGDNMLEVVLIILIAVKHASGSVDISIAALFPIRGWYPAGNALLTAAEMAIEHVNNRPDMLPGYTLKMSWDDTQVRFMYLK
jgi:hypothetical protein